MRIRCCPESVAGCCRATPKPPTVCATVGVMSIEPDLLPTDLLHFWADDVDADVDDTTRMAVELLVAREVLGLLEAGVLSVPSVPGVARTIWCPQRGWQMLAAIRPDLAAYLDALEALPKEDS